MRRKFLVAVLSAALVTVWALVGGLGASGAPGPTLTSKVTFDWTSGSATLITPEGSSAFKIPPTGDGDATLLRTGEMSARINGTTATFTTGLEGHPHEPHVVVAQFPSSDAIRFAFAGFEQIFTMLDGNLNPDNDQALRAIGTLSMFKFDGSDTGFASISLFTFWPAEGGVCEVFMSGTYTES